MIERAPLTPMEAAAYVPMLLASVMSDLMAHINSGGTIETHDVDTWIDDIFGMLDPLGEADRAMVLSVLTHTLSPGNTEELSIYRSASAINRAAGVGIVVRSDGEAESHPGIDDGDALRALLCPWGRS